MRISDWSSDVCSSDLIGHVGVRKVMRTLGHYVMRDDKRFAAYLQHRGIIFQPACGGVARQAAQLRDEVSLAAQRASFPIPSRMPLTNFASRSSKNALATST